jgi:hypothetical protein
LHPRRKFIIVIASCGLGVGCLSLLGGCADESKTTGTMLEMSPEVKAELDNMRSAQQEVRAERKRERTQRRGR